MNIPHEIKEYREYPGPLWNKNGRYPQVDYVGKVFGRLTILGWSGRNNQYANMWLCECECGNKLTVRQDSLNKGKTKSCGCIKKDSKTILGYNIETKGVYSLFRKFCTMRSRCYSKNNTHYKYYGGRGIKICDEWLKSSKAFMEWGFKNGYEEGLTIERIDNDGDYTPENCRFATLTEQANNKRSNHLLTYSGKTQNIAQWAKEIGLKYDTLRARIRYGWTTERALTTPIQIIR